MQNAFIILIAYHIFIVFSMKSLRKYTKRTEIGGADQKPVDFLMIYLYNMNAAQMLV